MDVSSPPAQMLQNVYVSPQQPGPFPTTGNYATSRSMSNLHRNAVSPQRNRRRWNVPNEQSYGESYEEHIPNLDIIFTYLVF